jgi:hypothetical protein
MANPLSRIALRAAYGAGQSPRVAWYVGHGLAMRRLAKAARGQEGGVARQRAHTTAAVPDRGRILRRHGQSSLARPRHANFE